MKKIFCLIMAVAMMLSCMSTIVLADDVTLQGSGVEGDPYLIGTEADLQAFANMVNTAGSSSAHIKFTADIALTTAHIPIGSVNKSFTGVIDGDGHTISNFTTGTGNVQGLVGEGKSGLVIKNLTIEGTMTDVDYSSAFVGRASGNITIENCVNKVNITGKAMENNARGGVGGFVGYTANAADSVTVKNCVNYGSVTGYLAGGILGYAVNTSTVIENCVNYGDIENPAGMELIASGIASCVKSLKNSYNFGTITITTSAGKAAPLVNGVSAINSVTNSYYNHEKIVNKSNDAGRVQTGFGVSKTTAQFTSGEIAYLLNQGAGEVIYGQELGVDNYPILNKTDKAVYKNLAGEYSNTKVGTGTVTDPYFIGTEAELKAFRILVAEDCATDTANFTSDLCATLTDDIVLTEAWSPIAGDNNQYYTGTINGAGHKITNMTNPSGAQDMAFVRYIKDGVKFKNLTIEGVFTNAEDAAAFVGNVSGAVVFENCVADVDINGTGQLGGFIARAGTGRNHSFKNCVNYGDITSSSATDAISGFIGNVGNGSVIYENCANYGAITGNTTYAVSGIAWFGTFTNCIGYGAVANSSEATYAAASPICNTNESSTKAINCFRKADNTTAGTVVNCGTAKEEADFTGGAVAYLINKGAKAIAYGQDLTNGGYPVPGGKMVYLNGNEYSNNEGVFLSADLNKAVLLSTEAAYGFIAQYDVDGYLVGVTPVAVNETVKTEPIVKDDEATEIKVFLWKTDFAPLCAPVELIIAE